MKEKINVIIKEPGQRPRAAVMENTLEAMQESVGGYIEMLDIVPGEIVAVVNEEGRVLELPENAPVRGDMIRGNIVIAGVDGEDLDDVGITPDTLEWAMEWDQLATVDADAVTAECVEAMMVGLLDLAKKYKAEMERVREEKTHETTEALARLKQRHMDTLDVRMDTLAAAAEHVGLCSWFEFMERLGKK